MRYFFVKMQRIRVVIILVIVGLIVAAYWLMTSSPKHVNIHRLKDSPSKTLNDNAFSDLRVDTGHFAGRLGRNAFPKSPDGKLSKNTQWKAGFDSKTGGKVGQIGRPLKDPKDSSKLRVKQKPLSDMKVSPLNPRDSFATANDVKLQRNWKGNGNPAEKKNPSDWRKNPSNAKSGALGVKDNNKSGMNAMENNKFGGLGVRDQKVGLSTDAIQSNRYGAIDKFGSQDNVKKPGDQMSQNTLNRNAMLDNKFALERKQLKEALQKGRTNFKYLDGKVEAYARRLGIVDSVFHRNKKYENKPRTNVSPVPHRMGPPEAYLITTDRKPKGKFMPSVGNGHIATVVDSDTVLMNGLYSGIGNASRRARIPPMIAFEISDFHPTRLPHKRNFTMNMLEGIYTETISGDDFIIEKRTYAHRSVPNLLISELDVFRWYKPGQMPLGLVMQRLRGSTTTSQDITIREGKCTIDKECIYVHGEVNAYETPSSTKPEVHAFYDPVPSGLEIPVVPAKQKGMRMRWIYTASIAGNRQEAESSFRLAEELIAKNELLSQHRTSWMNLWSDGALTMDGNLALSRAVFSAMYNTLSSLPTLDDQARPFFGLSPTDLAHGNKAEDYFGHITSDQEIWMFPNILLFHADLAKLLIKSRTRNQRMAQQNAKENGFTGAQFPAETAFSGIEVGPPESKYEIHPSGDISHAIMQYIYMTKDVHFYAETAKKLLIDVSNFYQNRLHFNMTRHKYGYNDVLSLDRQRGKVSNSIYTNTIAKIALSAPYVMSSYLGLKSDHFKTWLAVSNKTYIPYDEVMKFHPEDDSYQIGIKVNIPEALLLRYPLMQHVTLDSLRKDVSIYEREIVGPATAWTTLALNWMQLKDFETAWSKLKGTMMNIQQPFQVWTQTSTGGGAKNYLTLMGSFLQAVINGYVGIRILPDRLEFDPTLPPKVKTMNLTSVDYMGSAFDFKITENSILISMTMTKNSVPQFKVTVYATGAMHFIKMHQPALIARQRAAIFPIGSPKVAKPLNDVKVERMELPRGQLNQPKMDRQYRQNLPGQVPRPVVPQQGQPPYQGPGMQIPLKPNKVVATPNQNVNQRRFDRQSNSQGLANQSPPVIGGIRQAPIDRAAADKAPLGERQTPRQTSSEKEALPGVVPRADGIRQAQRADSILQAPRAGDLKQDPAIKLGEGDRAPVYNNLPIAKMGTNRESPDTVRKFKNLQDRVQPKKSGFQQEKLGDYKGSSGQQDQQDVYKKKGPRGRLDPMKLDTNIAQPQSALQYDNKKKKSHTFDYDGQQNGRPMKTRLRKRGERGL